MDGFQHPMMTKTKMTQLYQKQRVKMNRMFTMNLMEILLQLGRSQNHLHLLKLLVSPTHPSTSVFSSGVLVNPSAYSNPVPRADQISKVKVEVISLFKIHLHQEHSIVVLLLILTSHTRHSETFFK